MTKRDEQRNQAIVNMATTLANMGFDINGEDMKETPRRFIDYLLEFMQPYDPNEILGTTFAVEDAFHGIVVQASIPFKMACEHHLLPALGKASIGYIPHRRVVGLSKLARLVKCVGTSKPGLQETINDTICDDIQKVLEPKGVITVISAEHSCMACRGANVPGVVTYTSAVRGAFRDNPAAREEFFNLLKLGGHHG